MSDRAQRIEVFETIILPILNLSAVIGIQHGMLASTLALQSGCFSIYVSMWSIVSIEN